VSHPALDLLPADVDITRELVIEGVSHIYRSAGQQPVAALLTTDLVIESGSFVCLVGPSGCGKSTLLEILAGLRPPAQGRVTLGQRPVIGPGPRRGLVFQQPSSLFPWRTVAGNVRFGLDVQGIPRRERKQRVATELARVGLTDFADRRVYELSGGMQQRCQLARALATSPDILLLDEPFGSLDTFTREKLQEELRGIWRESQPTIIFVTHSIEEAALLSTRVLVMSTRPGRIIGDYQIGFTHRDESAAQLRADSDFVAFCSQLRSAIWPDGPGATSSTVD
jgi:ABC-type nitrate/sulfonate/bicarbonate transport system ATPase subunit